MARGLPRADGVPQHADPLDLELDLVARLEPAPVAVLQDGAGPDGAGAEDVAGPELGVPARLLDDAILAGGRGRRFPRERSSPFTRATMTADESSNSARRDDRPGRGWSRSPCPSQGPRPTFISSRWTSCADQSFMIVEALDLPVGPDHRAATSSS